MANFTHSIGRRPVIELNKKKNMSNKINPLPIVCTCSINVGRQSPEKIFYFFKNLDRYYLGLSGGHRKFQILNAKNLEEGVEIAVEEVAGGQYVKHRYKAIKVIPNKQIQLRSDPSFVNIGQLFNVQIATSVEFSIVPKDDGTTLLSSALTLEFSNSASLLAAKLLRVKSIWEAHLKEEMSNGMIVIESKEFISDYEHDQEK